MPLGRAQDKISVVGFLAFNSRPDRKRDTVSNRDSQSSADSDRFCMAQGSISHILLVDKIIDYGTRTHLNTQQKP